MEKGKEVSVVVKSPSELIELAIDKGNIDLDKLYKVLEFSREVEKDAARRAYNNSMADFKSKPIKIEKGKTVKFNQTKWNYAPLNKIVEAITPELSKYGLSVSWRTKQNGKIIVACRVSHVLGHYEEIELGADADTSGSKNSIQAIGSTISYLQRYTLLSILGLATEDMDDDGQSTVTEYIDDKQKSTIVDLLSSKNIGIPKFCEKFKVESFDLFPKNKYEQAITIIKAAKGKEK